jgi:hypothetical protein
MKGIFNNCYVQVQKTKNQYLNDKGSEKKIRKPWTKLNCHQEPNPMKMHFSDNCW